MTFDQIAFFVGSACIYSVAVLMLFVGFMLFIHPAICVISLFLFEMALLHRGGEGFSTLHWRELPKWAIGMYRDFWRGWDTEYTIACKTTGAAGTWRGIFNWTLPDKREAA